MRWTKNNVEQAREFLKQSFIDGTPITHIYTNNDESIDIDYAPDYMIIDAANVLSEAMEVH